MTTGRPKNGWKKPREPVTEVLFVRDLIRLTKQASLGLLRHPTHPRWHTGIKLAFTVVCYQYTRIT